MIRVLRRLGVLAWCGLMTAAAPAWAAPVSLGAGDSVGLNFQLGGSGGPYVLLSWTAGSLDPANAVVTIYDGLDLVDPLGPGTFLNSMLLDQAGRDGQFSLRITAQSAFVLDGPFILFSDRLGVPAGYVGTVITAVPEPASLGLAGLALAGLAAAGRRRRALRS